MLSGTMVGHDSANKNGDWGGETIEGIAQFSAGDSVYTGHLTLWGGGGNNVVGQSEGGFTLTFHGTESGSTLAVHITGHNTVSASGNHVGNVQKGNITCS